MRARPRRRNRQRALRRHIKNYARLGAWSRSSEGCRTWLRAAPFFARAACTRVKTLAAMPFGCKREAESDDLKTEFDVVARGAKQRRSSPRLGDTRQRVALSGEDEHLAGEDERPARAEPRWPRSLAATRSTASTSREGGHLDSGVDAAAMPLDGMSGAMAASAASIPKRRSGTGSQQRRGAAVDGAGTGSAAGSRACRSQE